MEERSITRSLDRIEAAMARIEAAARERKSLVTTAPNPEVDEALEQRHQALKAAVQGALVRLDTLIAEQS